MKKIIHLVIDGTIETEADLVSMLDNYGKRLKQRRKDEGLTLAQLGQMAELAASAIARIEREERIPSIGTVVKLEKALGKKQ